MRRTSLQLLAAVTLLAAISCGKEEPTSSSLEGSWRLSRVIYVLDGTEIFRAPATDLDIRFSKTSFFYEEDFRSQTGGWSFSEDNKNLALEYESTTVTYPFVSRSNKEFSIRILTIDMAKSERAEEERLALLFLNQSIIKSGSSWDQVVPDGVEMEVQFLITKRD